MWTHLNYSFLFVTSLACSVGHVVSVQVKIVPSCGAAVVGGVASTCQHQHVKNSNAQLSISAHRPSNTRAAVGNIRSAANAPEECLWDGERESLILSIFISLDLSAAALRQGPSNSWSPCQSSLSVSRFSERGLSVAGGILQASGWISPRVGGKGQRKVTKTNGREWTCTCERDQMAKRACKCVCVKEIGELKGQNAWQI